MKNAKKLIESWNDADSKLLELIRSNDCVAIYKPTGYNLIVSVNNNAPVLRIPFLGTFVRYTTLVSGALSYKESGLLFDLVISTSTITSNSLFRGIYSSTLTSHTRNPGSIVVEGERRILTFKEGISLTSYQNEYFFQFPRALFEKYVAEYGLKFELEKFGETV